MSTELLEPKAAESGIITIGSKLAIDVASHRQEGTFRPGACALKRALLTSLPLIGADLVALVLAIVMALGAVFVLGGEVAGGVLSLSVPIGLSLVIAFAVLGLYPGVGLNPIVELRQVSCGSTLVFFVFFAATQLQHALSFGARLPLIAGWVLTLLAIPLVRSAVRMVCARFGWWGQRVLVFGGGRAGQGVYQHLQARPWLGLRPVGIVDDFQRSEAVRSQSYYLGPPGTASAIAEFEGATWAIIAMPDRPRHEILRIVDRFAGAFPHMLIMPDMEGLPSLWTCAHECGGLPGLRVNERLLLPMPQLIKRLTDVSLILLSAPLVLPLVAIVSLLIKISSPGPVFYSQKRVGRAGRRFYVWKFRSMITDAEVALQALLERDPAARAEWEREKKLRNDPRITGIGKFLRVTSLDELPQLWNVLRGEMSLVGPRPVPEYEVVKYIDRFDLYSKVTPGITGLWQVSGRNLTTYEQRMALDAFYARNWSPWLDLFILACTVKVVLLRKGAC